MGRPEAETVLLLIDLQKAFCDLDGSVALQGRDITSMSAAAAMSAALARKARAAAIPVIWTRIVYRSDYLDGGRMIWEQRSQLRQRGALRIGTSDVAITEIAKFAAGDVLIDKPRYSALYSTALEAQLRALGTRRVIVAGVTTSMCVETTVRDLAQRDYETFVVGNACGDFDPARHEASLAAMAFGFASIISVDEAQSHLMTPHATPKKHD